MPSISQFHDDRAGSAAMTVVGAVTCTGDLSLLRTGESPSNAAVSAGANNLAISSGGPVTQTATITASAWRCWEPFVHLDAGRQRRRRPRARISGS